MSLSVENLNLSINQNKQSKQLLKNINTAIHQPKLVGIIGPNGAGKSTLLNCLSGLLPTNGRIKFNHQPLESFSEGELAKYRAALPQSTHLSFPFKACDIVGMSFALTSISKPQQQALICKCLAMMSATDLAERNYLTLSGGEKQRIQLARVFAQLLQSKPAQKMRLLLLDEPTAPLDLKYQFLLFKHLKNFVQQNISTITVIHDINLAATYCDEIWVMQDGELVRQDCPHQVISSAMMKSVFDVDVEITFNHKQLLPIISNSI